MLKRIFLTLAIALAMTMTFAETAFAAPVQASTGSKACVQAITEVGGWGGGVTTETTFGISFTATCPGKLLVKWQVADSNDNTVWSNVNHHFPLLTATYNTAYATWVFGSTPPGRYDIYVTLASQNGQDVYVNSLFTWIDVPNASATTTTTAQALAASSTCSQGVQVLGDGAGWGPTQAGFGVSFTANCPGRVLVKWQAMDGSGHTVWKSEDHQLSVSTTTVNNATANWVFGHTPPGTYIVYVTLANTSGKTVYYQFSITMVTVP